MIRYALLILFFSYNIAIAQQKERTINITCYANPELYMDAGVIAYVSDNSGNISCKGNYLTIRNQSSNVFYYQDRGSWLTVKPQAKAVVFMPGSGTTGKSPSVVKLTIKYSTDRSGNITGKIKTVDQLNIQSDRVKAREFGGSQSQKEETLSKAAAPSPSPGKIIATPKPSVKAQSSETKIEKENTVAKAQTSTRQTKSALEPKKQPVAQTKPKRSSPTYSSRTSQQRRTSTANSKAKASNALGLRVDFGDGPTGLGPSFKHTFNRNVSLDASLVFFKGNIVSLGGQLEKNFTIGSGDPGLSLYLGIGPQFLFAHDATAIAFVPVGGLEYNIPTTPLNIAVDWRPNFFISPENTVEAARFGFSFRVKF